MKISVVMATYNGRLYLEEQLESIRMQTVQPDEVIICDDCSKDQTVEIAKRFIVKNNLNGTWKVISNANNLGYADNFNKVAGLANGKFIFFADQDDIWNEKKIEKMLEIMEKYPDCQVLCTEYEPFSNGDDAPIPPKKILKQILNDESIEKISLSPKSLYLNTLGCCMCIRKTFYKSINKYWFNGWAQDDRMWQLSQCVEGCYLFHSCLVKHRLHGNNTSTYGKYHAIEKRIELFQKKQNANRQMLQMLVENGAEESKRSIIKKHIEMMELRLDLLENRNIYNCILLLKYLGYYQVIKSMLVEICIVLRGR